MKKTEKPETKVYFIRHGESEPPVEGIINHYPKLTPLGENQARNIARELLKIKQDVHKIYTSDLSRALETARIIGRKLGKEPEIKEEFRELNKIFTHKSIFHPRFIKYFKSYKKACRLFDKILAENEGRTLLFVIHGRRIISLIGYKLGLSRKQMEKTISLGNCHISELVFEGTKLHKLRCLNRTTLLDYP